MCNRTDPEEPWLQDLHDSGQQQDNGQFWGWLNTVVVPKPEALNLANNPLNNEYLQVKLFGQKDTLHDTYTAAPSATRTSKEVMEKCER